MGKLLKLALCALLATGIGSAWAQQAARLARGKYLMEGIIACGNCHVARGEQGQPTRRSRPLPRTSRPTATPALANGPTPSWPRRSAKASARTAA